MLFNLFRRRDESYGPHLEIAVCCDKYPYNILKKVFTKDEQKKFPKEYITNTRTLIGVLELEHFAETKVALMFYKDKLSEEQILTRTNLNIDGIRDVIKEFDANIKENRDVIEKGFLKSKIGSIINNDFIEIGFTTEEIECLNSSFIYNIDNILKFKSKSDIICEMSKYLGLAKSSGIVNSIIEKLNEAGYNTVKFDYYGKNYIKEEIPASGSDVDKKSASESENEFTEFKKGNISIDEVAFEKAERDKIVNKYTKPYCPKKVVYSDECISILKKTNNTFKNEDGKFVVDVKDTNIKSDLKVKNFKNAEGMNNPFSYYFINDLKDISEINDNLVYCVADPNKIYTMSHQNPSKIAEMFDTYIHIEGTKSDFAKAIYDIESGFWKESSNEVITVIIDEKETQVSGDNPFHSRTEGEDFPEDLKISRSYKKDSDHKEYKIIKGFKRYKISYNVVCSSCGRNLELQNLVFKDELSELVVMDWNKFSYCKCGKLHSIFDRSDVVRTVKLLITCGNTQ